mmetsp:Transcript_39146/g.76985  ORF Transcript_39146/g.76985 Transcript_39146/m.76985 type:complete len:145 (+) Transcript_39146:109-543(+)
MLSILHLSQAPHYCFKPLPRLMIKHQEAALKGFYLCWAHPFKLRDCCHSLCSGNPVKKRETILHFSHYRFQCCLLLSPPYAISQAMHNIVNRSSVLIQTTRTQFFLHPAMACPPPHDFEQKGRDGNACLKKGRGQRARHQHLLS